MRKCEEYNKHFIFIWRGNDKLTVNRIMDNIYDHENIENLTIKNYTQDAFHLDENIDISKYTNLKDFRIEHLYLNPSKNDTNTDIHKIYCRKCFEEFNNINILT